MKIWLLVVVLVGAVVAFGPSWMEAQEQVTLADLLELHGQWQAVLGETHECNHE